MYALTAAVLVAFLIYLTSSTFAWIAAIVLGVPDLTWERCAILGGFHIGAAIVLGVIISLWAVENTFSTGITLLGAMLLAAWFVVWITVRVLDIPYWKATGVVVVVAMFDQLVALVVERIIPLLSGLMGL